MVIPKPDKPCRHCGAPPESLLVIVTPEGRQRDIKNLGISPVAGREWTVTRCIGCGHLELFLG